MSIIHKKSKINLIIIISLLLCKISLSLQASPSIVTFSMLNNNKNDLNYSNSNNHDKQLLYPLRSFSISLSSYSPPGSISSSSSSSSLSSSTTNQSSSKFLAALKSPKSSGKRPKNKTSTTNTNAHHHHHGQSTIKMSGNKVSIRFNKYHNYDDMTRLLKHVAKKHSNLTRLYSIGRSKQGRELWVMHLTE